MYSFKKYHSIFFVINLSYIKGLNNQQYNKIIGWTLVTRLCHVILTCSQCVHTVYQCEACRKWLLISFLLTQAIDTQTGEQQFSGVNQFSCTGCKVGYVQLFRLSKPIIFVASKTSQQLRRRVLWRTLSVKYFGARFG